MDAVEALELALAALCGLVADLTADDLRRPSPCAGWTVADVVAHVTGTTAKFTEFAVGTTDAPRTPTVELGDDPAAVVAAAAVASAVAWAGVDPSRTCSLPFGTFSALEAAGIDLFDVLAHGWDVATATGRPFTVDAAVWEAGLAAARIVIGPTRNMARYAPERVAPPDAGAEDRFLAYLGRGA